MSDRLATMIRQFRRLGDWYYWQTAVLIARNLLIKQYRSSFLGVMWTLIQPITMVFIYSTIMPLIMRYRQDEYVVYIIASLPLWTLISSSLVLGAQSIILQAETLKRCIISTTVFPVADVLKNAYVYCISFTTMYIVGCLFFFKFSWIVLLIPLYLIPVLIILMAGAIAVAFLAPFVRDIGEAVYMAMTVFVWFTPVLYPIKALPERFQEWMQWNPFYIMMHPIQALAVEHTLPDPMATIRLFGLMLISIGLGYGIYKACRRNYVYYL